MTELSDKSRGGGLGFAISSRGPVDVNRSYPGQIVKLILPKEHGSWSLALEPLGLGLLVAPSPAGAFLAAGAIFSFFLRRPLKIALSGKSDPRQCLAIGCVISLVLFTSISLLLAVKLSAAIKLWPLLPAGLAGFCFAWFDSRNKARLEAAELAGTIAFGILPATFGSLAGWHPLESVALALVMLTRSIPTVIFVRTYMRLRKGQSATRIPSFIAAVIGFFLAISLVYARIAPWPAVLFAFLIAALTFWLLGDKHPRFAAKTIGFVEMTVGVAMVLALDVSWKYF